ncbi:putative secreted protein (Por secretion system target) [Ulvibacter sp. MAR_2010_11]|uniref:T9SS type A sorting domain-containing protein n=1 Tax=Ulvibacter sp. MAR_2010_11 TaxID=1250229 RepID=UPI000C2BA5C0|nr:T9SS type A sorting domain-containing protein [Ulvibacter sp. MAR_2010_11]PKA83145.1 putative secreted protein (Por secretion system target) [Ulvibacter sp. MAR_2010_11]
MKNKITLAACLLLFTIGFAQTDDALLGTVPLNTEKTPELEALYQQSKILEMTGTAAEINANRLAIKAAWQEVNPAISNLYRPIGAPTYDKVGFNGTPYVPGVIKERSEPEPTREWTTDLLVRAGFIDGVDMDVTGTGDIYIAAFENLIDFGGTEDFIYIYKSTDNGASFSLWKEQATVAPIRKVQLISMDGSGDEYLIAFTRFENGLLQAVRFDFPTASMDFQTVDTDVTDFGVDRNYPGTTASQRCFVAYQKTTGCTEVFSARSTAGSYGFDWIDPISIAATCGSQVEFTYGLNGACYATYTGASSGNLYANANPSYNDPASWEARETIVDGAIQETLNPVIAAARNDFATDKVIIWTSDRAAGSTDNYNGKGYLRDSGAAYVEFTNFGSGGANWNIAHTDKWVRKVNGTEIIRTSYVRDNIDDSEFDLNRSLTFNGTGFDTFESVADVDHQVFDGFPSATAETADNMPCMAFAGTSGSGLYGFDLYFDNKAGVLAIQDQEIDGLSYYPNPAGNELHVSANESLDQITMFTLLGQQVLQIAPNNTRATLETASLSQGIYVLKIESQGKSNTYKIVKE